MSKLSKWWAGLFDCPHRKNKKMENDTRQIGETFYTSDGVKLEVCESCGLCKDCYFKPTNTGPCNRDPKEFSNTGCCSDLLRKDKCKVIFKEIKKEKTMKKSDLKLGNIVECRNGATYMLVKTEKREKVFIGLDGFIEYDNYDENMLDTSIISGFIDKAFDIVKVYKGDVSYGFGFKGVLKNKGHLLWERQDEITELTLEDVAKKFNVNVKNLRIKD